MLNIENKNVITSIGVFSTGAFSSQLKLRRFTEYFVSFIEPNQCMANTAYAVAYCE